MKTKLAFLLSATLVVATARHATAEEKNKQWQDQETWYQFTDKESQHAFKGAKRPIPMTTPPAPNEPAGTPAEPELRVPSIFSAPATAPTANNGETYILNPAPTPHEQPATTHVETSWVPTGNQNSLALPFWGGIAPYWGGRNWTGNGYWGGNNWGRHGGWGYSPWVSPLGMSPFNNGPSMRPIKKVVQTGPSKASGNYYAPSTPDPTASGSYYADPGNTGKASTVYQPEAQPKDYWGKQGNPLPPEMQPQ